MYIVLVILGALTSLSAFAGGQAVLGTCAIGATLIVASRLHESAPAT